MSNLCRTPIYQKSVTRYEEHLRDFGSEKAYMDAVAKLGCIIKNSDCWGKLELHHKTGAGMAKRADNFEIMPLCFDHHSAQTRLGYGHSVHKGTKTFESIYGTQDELIEKTRQLVREGLCQ